MKGRLQVDGRGRDIGWLADCAVQAQYCDFPPVLLTLLGRQFGNQPQRVAHRRKGRFFADQFER